MHMSFSAIIMLTKQKLLFCLAFILNRTRSYYSS